MVHLMQNFWDEEKNHSTKLYFEVYEKSKWDINPVGGRSDFRCKEKFLRKVSVGL